MDLKTYLKEKKALVDGFLESYFSRPFSPKGLHEAIVYSLTAGGKRLRPILCIASHQACGGEVEAVLPFAAAFELIHTYSLIHDDLPAMDNDDLRRGKPTSHKVFGEGMAILAGDGLLTEAFSLFAHHGGRGTKIPAHLILRGISALAHGAGIKGMVAGQAQDLLSEDVEPDPITLTFIHHHKTAALITAALQVGAILAGCTDDQLQRLTDYGENTGLAFQVVDDILDVVGDTQTLGKPKGSDEKKKKMTYPKLYGIEESSIRAKYLVGEAIKALTAFDKRAEPLRLIAQYMLERRY